jgi:hypothetical protein
MTSAEIHYGFVILKLELGAVAGFGKKKHSR